MYDSTCFSSFKTFTPFRFPEHNLINRLTSSVILPFPIKSFKRNMSKGYRSWRTVTILTMKGRPYPTYRKCTLKPEDESPCSSFKKNMDDKKFTEFDFCKLYELVVWTLPQQTWRSLIYVQSPRLHNFYDRLVHNFL